MLAEERFREILKIVNEKKNSAVTELTELLDTSESTIRRDLTQLHKRGALLKVHGGSNCTEWGIYDKGCKGFRKRGAVCRGKTQHCKAGSGSDRSGGFCLYRCRNEHSVIGRGDFREGGRVCDEWNSACKVSGRKRLAGWFCREAS